jgi:hypothetical protein
MTPETKPIHQLRDTLEQRRLKEIERLAAANITGGTPADEALRSLAHLQLALTAVREEIAAHDIKLGGGSEKPLE